MYISHGNNQLKRIGSNFPSSPNDTTFKEKSSITELFYVYERVSELCSSGQWDINDFKKFRTVLCKFGYEDMENFGQLITFLLSFSPEQTRNLVINLDREFSCHIFEERVKKVEVDPDTKKRKETYFYQSRDYNVGDIVTIISALIGKSLVITNSFTDKYLEFSSDMTVLEKINICEELYEGEWKDSFLTQAGEEFNRLFEFYQTSDNYSKLFDFYQQIITMNVLNKIDWTIMQLKKSLELEHNSYKQERSANIYMNKALKGRTRRKFVKEFDYK